MELIFNLHKRGLSNREITDYLMLLGIKKRNTQTNYTVKDVYMCIKKLKLREERLNKVEYVLGEWIVNFLLERVNLIVWYIYYIWFREVFSGDYS